MSTNGVNVEDAEMAECDGEKVVTMMDVLQEQQEFEDDANAVLGASDDKNCTYNQGYIKRQAVYACLTCCNDAKIDPEKRAGVCLACSLTCHENHDLLELYTKRNFCCDCGNPKFNHPCQYTQNKTTLNDDNVYNQNFSGLYCTCHRPYPDPDGVEEEMIQCIVCEDWLHASHLEATVPSSELYAEMICKACMEKNEFLHDYGKYAVNGDIDVVDISETLNSSIKCNGIKNEVNGVDANKEIDKAEIEDIKVSEEVRKDTNPTELLNASHDNIDENKAEEPAVPKDSTSQKTDAEETEGHDIVSDKADDENHAEANQTKDVVSNKTDAKENEAHDIVSDIADDDNHAEANQTKDVVSNKTDAEENEAHDIVSDKADDENHAEANQTKDVVSNKTDDENLEEASQATNDKADENPTEETQATENTIKKEILPSDDKTSENLSNESSTDQGNVNNAPVSSEIKEESTTSSKDNDCTGDIELNLNEQNGQENGGKVDDAPQAKVDSEEKQDPTDSSLMDAADTSVEMDKSSHVTDNRVKDTSLGDEQINENKRKLSVEESVDDVSVKKAKLSESKCIRPQGEKKRFKGATFWPCQFRQKLCTCNECITMYKDLAVLFLVDPEDTVTAYEVLGKEKSDGTASTQYEKGLEALSSLGRVQQINALTEYNKMRDKLLDFLKSFKDRKEVVKEEDIKAFFAGMKPKREPDGVYFCR